MVLRDATRPVEKLNHLMVEDPRGSSSYNTVMRRLTVEFIRDLEYGEFTAHVPNIPAYGEGATEDEAVADLREAVAAYVAAFGMEDALA
jgi:predicted RNase H-like HicB family nuclease